MKITVQADASNQKQILTLIEEMGCRIPCNCKGNHRCPGNRYSFDCAMIPKAPVTVTLPDTDSPIRGIALENRSLTPGPADTLLVDLGTTSVALVLMDRASGCLRQSHVFPNPQRSMGVDVISRIQASCNGEGKKMKQLICQALTEETRRLCQKNNQDKDELRHCLIGGNTTMAYLLLGYDCSSLAASPFIPGIDCPQPFSYHHSKIQIVPWLSAFIGGDILAGIHACGLENDGPALLIDLGTNGEMVLSHNGHFYIAAAAAGPALEGGSLTCGCPAVPGAICDVKLRRGCAITKTVDNKLPVGLCGSGALSLCAELLRHGFLNTEGILSDSFPDEGICLGRTAAGSNLYFTAEDVRELQLATASIGAGIDTLCKEAGIRPDALKHLYLGGGFGFFLPIQDAVLLRILPSLSPGRIHPMGNTCLQGLYQYAVEPCPDIQLPSSFSIVNLASHPYYKKMFIHHMTYSVDVSSTTNS